jgi:hypothetical protein
MRFSMPQFKLTVQQVVDMLDIKLFLQVPSDLLKSRREERQTYVLQSESSHHIR